MEQTVSSADQKPNGFLLDPTPVQTMNRPVVVKEGLDRLNLLPRLLLHGLPDLPGCCCIEFSEFFESFRLAKSCENLVIMVSLRLAVDNETSPHIVVTTYMTYFILNVSLQDKRGNLMWASIIACSGVAPGCVLEQMRFARVSCEFLELALRPVSGQRL